MPLADPFLIALLFGSLVLLIGLWLVFRLNPRRQKGEELVQVLSSQQPGAWIIFDGKTFEALKASPEAVELFGMESSGQIAGLSFDSMFAERMDDEEISLLLKSIQNRPIRNRSLALRRNDGESFISRAGISLLENKYLFCVFNEDLKQAEKELVVEDDLKSTSGSSAAPEAVASAKELPDARAEESAPLPSVTAAAPESVSPAVNPLPEIRIEPDQPSIPAEPEAAPVKESAPKPTWTPANVPGNGHGPQEAPAPRPARFTFDLSSEPRPSPVQQQAPQPAAPSLPKDDETFEVVRQHSARSMQSAGRSSSSRESRSATEQPVSEGAAILAYTGNFLEANEALSVMTGYSVQELLRLSIFQLIHPEEAQAHERWFEMLCGDRYRVLRARRRLIHKAGTTIWLDLTGAAMPGKRFVVLSAMDLSEELRFRQENLHSRTRLEAVLENTGEAVFSLNALGKVTVINPRARLLLENHLGKPLDSTQAFELQLAGQERKTWKERFGLVLTGKTLQYRSVFHDGKGGESTYEIELNPLIDEDELITGITFSGRDITARMQQEEVLRQARDKAEEVTKAKSDFLALMSHEIRTPLNGLLGMSELLNSTSLDPRQKEYVDIIRLSGEALLEVINDVLDFSKIEANKLQLEQVPYRVADAVNESMNILSGRAQEKDLMLLAEIDPAVPQVIVGDKVRLRQVLLNLVGNAIKFTERGQVKVLVRTTSGSGQNLVVEFEVRDTGIGIDQEKAKGLFTAFHQGDVSTFRRYGGTGLGLTICKTIVSMMGGRIWLESQPGEGSSFFFTVNTQAAAEIPRAEPVPAPSFVTGKSLAQEVPMRILLAEDNDINRLLAVKILERLGYQIVAVANGKEAFERLRQQDFDLVLMDIQMPEWDGLEATRQIRSGIPPGRQPVIVAMTAFAGTEDRVACSQAGMDDYVSKPITTNDLENILRKWSGHARSLQPGVPLPDAPEEQDVARIDREAVQRLMDIARQSDPGFIQQVMELFEKQAPVVLNDLRDAVVKMDLTAVWKSAHKLKGTCVNLGAGKMASICRELEKKGRNFEGTGLMPLVQRLEQEYEVTSRELREMLQYN